MKSLSKVDIGVIITILLLLTSIILACTLQSPVFGILSVLAFFGMLGMCASE